MRESPTLLVLKEFGRALMREIVWYVDLDDDYGDPNLMKLIAAVFAVAAVQGTLVRQVAVTGFDIGMGFLACCAYAGYRGLKLFASWKGIKLEDRRETIDATVRVITDRRKEGGGLYEPTPP